jgi:hypothetical protein
MAVLVFLVFFLRHLIDVGLVNASWVPRLSAELGVRLQSLLDNPE